MVGVRVGVRDQVREGLLEQVAVRHRGRLSGAIEVDGDVRIRRLLGEDLLEQRPQRNHGQRRVLVAALHARQGQQGAAEAPEAHGLTLEVPEEPVAFLRDLLRAALEDRHRGRNRGQGRAQLVRRVRDELLVRPLAALAAGDVVVDDDRSRDAAVRVAERPRRHLEHGLLAVGRRHGDEPIRDDLARQGTGDR